MDGLLDRQQQLAEVLGVLAVQNTDAVLNRREEEYRNIGDPGITGGDAPTAAPIVHEVAANRRVSLPPVSRQND